MLDCLSGATAVCAIDMRASAIQGHLLPSFSYSFCLYKLMTAEAAGSAKHNGVLYWLLTFGASC
jgi:hypothetical protein